MNADLYSELNSNGKGISRRSGLVNGAKAAFAAPAVVAALRAGVAHADSGSGRSGSRHTGSRPRTVTVVNAASGTHTGTNTGTHALTTATHTHTGTATGTHFEVAGLNTLFSGNLKTLPLSDTSANRGAVFFFGQNGVVQKIFVRVKRVLPNATFRLVFVQGSSNAPLLQFTSNGEGKFRKVFGGFNVALAFTQGTFFLQRLNGSNWTNVLQLVRHKA